jgi:hypothetical protein
MTKTNVVNFPSSHNPEVTNEERFEQHADAALLLHCFEQLSDALESLCENGRIEMEGDIHFCLLQAFHVVQVMFKRKTGHDAKNVAHDHMQAMRAHLIGGGPPADTTIPVVTAPFDALPASAFEQLTDHELACASFNYAARVRDAVMDHSPHALALSETRIAAIDATTALGALVLRMFGGSVERMSIEIGRQPGETLQ